MINIRSRSLAYAVIEVGGGSKSVRSCLSLLPLWIIVMIMLLMNMMMKMTRKHIMTSSESTGTCFCLTRLNVVFEVHLKSKLS